MKKSIDDGGNDCHFLFDEVILCLAADTFFVIKHLICDTIFKQH